MTGATVLLGDDATKDRVMSELPGRALFHFAGHGALDGPWRSHLKLNDGRLDALDILVERPAVGVVVLNGCDTGAAHALGRTQSIALPELWWVAGAQAVLSTTRPINDQGARVFIERFYQHGGADHPVQAYRAAALASADTDPTWQAFRVVGLR